MNTLEEKMTTLEEKRELIKKNVRCFRNFPKTGVMFRDVCSLLKNPEAFRAVRDVMMILAKQIQPTPDVVVAVDARGFLFGPLLALELGIPFVPCRKKGKLPGKCVPISFSRENGQETIEMHQSSLTKGQNVVVLDDVIRTGGTLKTVCELIQKLGGNVLSCIVILEVVELNGRKNVPVDILTVQEF